MNRHLGCATALVSLLAAQPSAASPLSDGFQNPPASAKPRVWWHWMNGNITKEGIKLDLEWMKRIGIGGVQNFDASLDTPKVVDRRLSYMTPEWKDAFRYAATLSDQLGLELGVASSPGWSESGGPWVKPEQAMKKLVWSDTVVDGGQHVVAKLPQPPAVAGPFQDIARTGGLGAPVVQSNYYADSVVIAYRESDPADTATPKVSSGIPGLDLALLSDGSLNKSISMDTGDSAWIQFDFDRPETIRSFVLGSGRAALSSLGGGLRAQLKVAGPDGTFSDVTAVTAAAPQTTVSFAPVTGRTFRVYLSIEPLNAEWVIPATGVALGPIGAMLSMKPKIDLSELRLSTAARINQSEAKAGFATVNDYYAIPTPSGDTQTAASPKEVVDLTSKMRADGTLEWDAPAGRWHVLRMGQALLGTTNHPATPEATGLEVDKLNARFVDQYMQHYLDSYSSFLGPDLFGHSGVRAVVSDSTEVDPQNWTDDILAQFQKRRGYDPRPWLPAMTGVVIGSAEQSDRFLWDFRETLAEMMTDQHYAAVANATKGKGLVQYGESLEGTRQVLGDDLAMRKYTDIPMAAMWMAAPGRQPRGGLVGDDLGAASVAHLYGQNLAAAESMTSAMQPWNFAPHNLKPVVDLEFALGINRIVVHTSVHQPLINKAPGLTLSIFGQYFNRNETWAEQAGPWVSYITRSSYMLQQGRFHADVAYFYGQDTPVGILTETKRLNDLPTRYGFDFVNADALLNLLTVQGNELATPSGMRYRILYLGGTSRQMTLSVLQKIAALVDEGATVVGSPPAASPSLADDQGAMGKLVRKLWGEDGKGARLGKGRVIAGADPEAALAGLGVEPDFDYSKPEPDSKLMFLHRTLPGADIYFVSNRQDRSEALDAKFRISGRVPEIWHADTGKIDPVSYSTSGNVTTVPLSLDPNDAIFVVFSKRSEVGERKIASPQISAVGTVTAPWSVAFQANRGAPASIEMAKLQPLNDSQIPGVKYFSGTATYSSSFMAPALRSGEKAYIDLGDVREIADISVNGQPLGTAWKAPFRVDVTSAIHPGSNKIDVRVTNLWVNRLIGDAQPGAQKVTFTAEPAYEATAPLKDSGLLGPVRILVARQ